MAEAFDPYHRWLGIPPEDQPPDHYRLLGIKQFEENPDVIASAADQRMKHLRDFQAGPHGPLSQRLLNEVAVARICLLNEEKKAAYDGKLHRLLGAKHAASKAPVAASVPGEGPVDHAARDPLALGQLGEYRLLEKLGAGGMGDVYKAVHTEMDRMVAVKVLPTGHLQDERAVARFKREIKAVASLSHPNIVQAYDAREIEGTRFLVMEYVEGMDLREVAKRLGPLPIPDACELVRQAALGLQCAHEHGLVHRDVKPGNLILTAGGQVKLLDLGLARPQAEGDEVTGTGEAMGTADYMAPEQVQDSRSVDIRADIYSLGCTLYRLIAGHPPFSGPKYNTAVKKLMGHVQDTVPPISRFRNDVPKPLQIVLGRLLAKDPAKRLGTPIEVAEALAPLSVTGDLPALYARAATTPATAAASAREQATMAAQESQSTGLTHFLQKIKGSGPAPAESLATSTSAGKGLPPYLGYAAIAAVMLLLAIALGVVLSSRSSNKEPVAAGSSEADRSPKANEKPPAADKAERLLIQWPQSERDDARLEIDRWPRRPADVADPKNPEQLTMEVSPGVHTIWINRRGYEPFEKTLKVRKGETVTIIPEWKKVTEVAMVPPPEPEEKPEVKPEVKPEPTKPEPATEEKPKPADVAEKPEPKPQEKPEPPQPKIDPAIQAREEKWHIAMEPVEKAAAAWDFAGAQAALEKVSFEEPELKSRLARRRDELERMVVLKAKMIARIKAAQPKLTKRDLMLRGINGEVTGADEAAIHATLSGGKAEDHPWAELNDKARPELLKLAIEQSSADDWLAAGLMAFAAGDVALAEKVFDKAGSLGADVDPYRGSLASAAFVQAKALLDEEKWAEAETALAGLTEKYAATQWLGECSPLVEAALARAKSGAYEAAAEKIYIQAAKLFEKKDLFELTPLVQKLSTEYPRATLISDPGRKPSFAEMADVTANLGKFITVRQDGKGDFKSIQTAIDKAPPNSVVEVQDNGPYYEAIRIGKDAAGLTLRGGKGVWPVVRADGPLGRVDCLLTINPTGVSVQNMIFTLIVNEGTPGSGASCLGGQGQAHFRSVILGQKQSGATNFDVRGKCIFDDCFVGPFSNGRSIGGGVVIRNSIWLDGMNIRNGDPVVLENVFTPKITAECPCSLRYCTVPGLVELRGAENSAVESILGSVLVEKPGTSLRLCNIFLKTVGPVKVEDCLTVEPGFANPVGLDYRLLPKSPCRGKASDGGDLGVRFTPEMIEILKVALELRRMKLISF